MEGAWRVLICAQDTEPASRTDLELNTGLIIDHVVLAIAEEGEVIGVQPAEQLSGKI